MNPVALHNALQRIHDVLDQQLDGFLGCTDEVVPHRIGGWTVKDSRYDPETQMMHFTLVGYPIDVLVVDLILDNDVKLFD